MQDRKKLPFDKDRYRQMLDRKLAGEQAGTVSPVIDRLKRTAQMLRIRKVK